MEVFIRDEDKKWDISYSLADKKNSLDCKDHKPIIPKSLDQHDLEIRADERKKVCEELEEWVYNNWYYTWKKENRYDDEEVAIHKDLDVKSEDLRQKLTELKGEKE